MQSNAPMLLPLFPRAIVHLDGDAFFTSVEQAIHPSLRGRPVVTGKERGIIACASYEAKALGIKRGVQLWEAQKICPDLVVLPSDYETYSIFSKRMFEIMRRYTPMVEEYSIDEGFADLTGFRSVFRCSYREIAKRMQGEIQRELDLTVSVGLSLTKSLAKLASDFRKPQGFTAVNGRHVHLFLQRLPVEDVWGLGPNRVKLLHAYGVHTAWDYVCRDANWIRNLLHKPGVDIWKELRGEAVLPLETDAWCPQTGISKGKTFTAPSADKNFIYARLLRNVESACIKLRRHHMCAQRISIALRQKDYYEEWVAAAINRPSSLLQEMTGIVRGMFEHLYREGEAYRSTAVVLDKLSSERCRQRDLFDDNLRIDKMERAVQAIDGVNARYGKHRLCSGAALYLKQSVQNDRDEPSWRKVNLLPGETARKRIHLPMLDMVV